MTIAQLLKDKAVTAGSGKDPVRGLTRDFVVRRAQRWIDLEGSDEERQRRDLTPAGTATVKAKLLVEIPQVRDTHKEIQKRVSTDPAHMELDMAAIRKRVETIGPHVDGRRTRRDLVATIVFQAAAHDVSLAGANLDRMHALCDRRLRVVERMLYDVGRAESLRRWNKRQIEEHRGGPWVDGLNRIFEYPRVLQGPFRDACDADANAVCRAPMADWRVFGTQHLSGPIRTNPDTRGSWKPSSFDSYSQQYTKGALNAVDAVKQMFQPSTDHLTRNLLFCDHVIHALHIEALVFSVEKRLIDVGSPGVHEWLDHEADLKPTAWLRLYVPITPEPGTPYLASRSELAHFDFGTVRAGALQPGDHLIVYNHPAYQHATVDGFWRLENAIVVQSHPEVLMQGHGSLIHDIAGMRRDMLSLFNGELKKRRRDVDGLATVVGEGPQPRQVRVNTVAFLQKGMRVEIADRTTDVKVAADREITDIDHRNRVVTYSGDDVTTHAGLVVRRARTVKDGFEQIDFGHRLIRRRVPVDTSTYAGSDRRADWWLWWQGNTLEAAIRMDDVQRPYVKQKQLVDYEKDPRFPDPTSKATWGWFPLWLAAQDGTAPRRNAAGLITNTYEFTVLPKHVAAWNWFFDADPTRHDLVPVLRPREP